MSKGILALVMVVLAASTSLAGPLEKLMLMNTKIMIIQSLTLPPYVRIDADLFNESNADLSGEWRLTQQRGHLKLKQNGLDHITIYLWHSLAADTVRKTIEALWVSDLDEVTTDTLRISLDWRKAVRLDSPPKDEWILSEMKRESGGGNPYVTLLAPVPAKILVLLQEPKRMPIDTLFNETNYRGFRRIEIPTEKLHEGNYTAVLYVNGVVTAYRALLEPKAFEPKTYYYGE